MDGNLLSAECFELGEVLFFWSVIGVNDDVDVDVGEFLEFEFERVSNEWFCLCYVSFFCCRNEGVGAAAGEGCSESIASLVCDCFAKVAGFGKAFISNVGVFKFCGECCSFDCSDSSDVNELVAKVSAEFSDDWDVLEFLDAKRNAVCCVVVDENRKPKAELVAGVCVCFCVSDCCSYGVNDVVREVPLVDAKQFEKSACAACCVCGEFLSVVWLCRQAHAPFWLVCEADD